MRTKAKEAARPSSRLRLPTDYVLFAATLALVVIGLLLVADTSYVQSVTSEGGDAFSFAKRQAVGAVLGFVALFVMMRLGYWKLRPLAVPMMFLGAILLCLVWVPGLGDERNGAMRWIKLGPLNCQPSEIAKLTLIVYTAALLSRPTARIRDLMEGLGPPLLIAGLYCFLIEREPDLGTAVVLLLAVLTQFYLAGARKRHLGLIAGGALLAVMVIGFGFGHRGGRISSYFHPERDPEGTGRQTRLAREGVGSGGWLGAGPGQGRQKFRITQANSDFIFVTLAEELGFVFTTPVVMLLCVVGWRGFRIALQTRDRFGSLLAGGIAALISWQALINIGVATVSIPATGVPLPFLSFGSTSLIFLLAGVGIQLNIAQHPVPPGEHA